MFLWLFQVIFLNKYYEYYKTKSIKKIADQITSSYQKNDDDAFLDKLEEISIEEGICIEFATNDEYWYYSSNMNHSCLNDKKFPSVIQNKKDFINSQDETTLLKMKSNNNINSLVYGLKLDNSYIFLNTILDPIDSTIIILKNQLLYVTIIVIILASIIAYFISNRLSKPITRLNRSAKAIAGGDYHVIFPNTDIAEINELSNSLNYALTQNRFFAKFEIS